MCSHKGCSSCYFFLISYDKMLNRILFFLFCCCPWLVAAQSKASSDTIIVANSLPEGFISAGAVNELWVIANHLPAGYSSLTYRGPGDYIGGGFQSRNTSGHLVSYGIFLDYIQYNMTHQLSELFQAHTSYQFAHIAPAIFINPAVKSILVFKFCGVVSLMQPFKSEERSYFELGIKGCIEYRAYQALLGFSYGLGPASPSTDISTRGWHEQMFTAGFAVYPFRLKPVQTYRKKRIINWAQP